MARQRSAALEFGSRLAELFRLQRGPVAGSADLAVRLEGVRGLVRGSAFAVYRPNGRQREFLAGFAEDPSFALWQLAGHTGKPAHTYLAALCDLDP